jgi:tetratricopeptide (TPR) repeat protein
MARQMAEQSVVLFRELDDQRGLADALLLIGHAMLWQGEATEGYSRLVEALALYQDADDRLGVARTLSGLGSYLADWGGDRSGRVMLEESVAILKVLGDRYFIASTLVSLGIVSLGSGEFASARAHFEEALAVARETGHVWCTADALTNLSGVARIVGDYDVGRTYAKEALQIYKEQGFSIWRADPLCALAEIDIAQGDLSSGQSRLQEASTLVAKSENKWLQTLVSYFLGLLAYYEGDTERAAMFLDESTTIARNSQYMPDLARSLITLGRVMRARGDVSQAIAWLREGLGLYHRLGHKLGIAIGLEGFAGLLSEKDATYAAKLFGVAQAIREAIGAPLPPVDCPHYESDVARTRAQLVEAAFVSAWAEGHAMTMEQAMECAKEEHR